MSKTILETALFDRPASELFSLYTDSERHSAALGASVAASAETGAEFSAFGGSVRGRNLLVVPGRAIVQSWRGAVWEEEDPDSILVLGFADTPSGGAISLVHTNIPERCFPHIDWERAYWRPWRLHLARRAA